MSASRNSSHSMRSKQMAELRERAAKLAGPDLEDWKRDTRTALAGRRRNEYQGS